MKERLMRIYQAARGMILDGKDLTITGLPEVVVLRGVSGIEDISTEERDHVAKSIRDEQAAGDVKKAESDAEAAAQPSTPGRTSLQVHIPNMRPINHRRLLGRFHNVFDEKDMIVPVSLGVGHIKIDFTEMMDPEEVKTTVLSVLTGWGYSNPEAFVR